MPNLSLRPALTNPALLDGFLVVRRPEKVNAHGRSTVKATRTPAYGVVAAASPRDLQRLPEADLMDRHLSIVTIFPLRGPAAGFKPDLVLWRGDSYLVKDLAPYPQYGPGWVHALVGSVDITDKAVPGKGVLDFSDAGQSDLAGAI